MNNNYLDTFHVLFVSFKETNYLCTRDYFLYLFLLEYHTQYTSHEHALQISKTINIRLSKRADSASAFQWILKQFLKLCCPVSSAEFWTCTLVSDDVLWHLVQLCKKSSILIFPSKLQNW